MVLVLAQSSFEFSGKSFYADLARISRCSLRGPRCMKILTKVVVVKVLHDIRQTSLHDLVQVLRRFCEDPADVL